MQLNTQDQEYERPDEELDPPDRWFLRGWTAQSVVVALCAVAAMLWTTSGHGHHSDQVLAGGGTPSVVGEPSPSILAAARAATPGVDQSTGALGSGTVAVEGTGASVVGSQGTGTPAPDTSATDAPATGALQARPAPFALTDPDATASPGTTTAAGAVTPEGSTSTDALPRPETPTRVFPVNQTDRLTTQQLVTMVQEHNITNVADFLSALPPFMGESFTLMEESRSRHQASIDYPRLIMYGPDARILIGVSSHPLDPLREVAEVAELDESTGLWRFSQFDFTNAFVHDTDAQTCVGCHGSPLRPIWGEYPNWDGAFAGQDERLSGGQSTALMDLKYDPLDRFHHLVFPSDHSIQNNGQFYLSTREYGYANTSFNFELNAAVADGLARRIINHPNWASEGYRMLAVQWDCARNLDAAAVDAMYNRFGIDGNNDFQLESPVFEANASQRDEYDWNQGSTGLDNSVAFRTLDLASRQDPELEAIVGADQLFVDFSNYWFNILGAPRSEFLRSNGIYETDFRPQNLSGAFVGRVCDYLASKGA